VWREEAPGPQVAKRNQQPTAYCLGPASGCGLCAVAARSIKNALMLKQGRQISRKRSSQSNSLADGRVYDRLEEETSQPPYLPLSFSRPDLGVCRDRTVVFGQNGSRRANDYATTTPPTSRGTVGNSISYCWHNIRRECVGEASRRARGPELVGHDRQGSPAG